MPAPPRPPAPPPGVPRPDDAGRRRRILEERVLAIAEARDAGAGEAPEESVPVLAFRLGAARFAVEVGAVFQVGEARSVHPLPATPPWLVGAIVARTRLVPVLDLRPLLGADGPLSDLPRVVVVEHAGETFGLAAEELLGRLDVPVRGLAPAADGPFAWVAPDGLRLLDLARVGPGRSG